MGIFEKFKFGFKKSAENIKSGLREIIVKKEIDDETLNKIEEFLISSDVGIDAASEIKSIIAEKKIDPNKETVDEINLILKNYILELMTPLERKDFFENKEKLNITLVSGVNGVGKTTTIGKIGKIFKDNGSEVLFSACDTFRAAAIEQLEAWSGKVGVPIVKSDPGSDPASVAYKSIEYAKNNNIKRVLIDTAGRLQNKKNLMDEFKKIANVICDARGKTLGNISDDKCPIKFTSIREDVAIGTHEVIFRGERDSVTITHIADDRSIFARGSIDTAVWLSSQNPGFYSYNDYMKSMS